MVALAKRLSGPMPMTLQVARRQCQALILLMFFYPWNFFFSFKNGDSKNLKESVAST
jgi:hypothetical protein